MPEVGVWIAVMEDAVLGLTQGVPVINTNGSEERGVCVKDDDAGSVDIAQSESCFRRLVQLERDVPLDGTDTTFRVDLSEPQGMSWALTHGIALECVKPDEDLWCALLDRHWTRKTTDDDREALALALVAGLEG